jgi:DNA-binding CsgD family transcriptional regulator
MQRLEEANMAAAVGEMTDIDATCTTYTCLIYACERTRDLEQAAQWCAHLKELSSRWSHQLAFAQCRSHFANLLMWQGEWAAAEAELLEATRSLESTYSALAAENLLRLAELRARQGRFAEAEALLTQAESGPYKLLGGDLCLLGRASLALEQDAPDTAVGLAERFLRGLPVDDKMRQVAALELMVKAQVARDEVARASNALVELSAITATLSTRPMQASARFAAGLVFAAQNNRDSAKACFMDAVDWWTRSHMPFQAAQARVQLARVLAAFGRHLEATEETRSALAVLRTLGATREIERATALLRRLEGPPAARDGTGQVLTKRELQVLRLIARGLSNKEIALQLIVSEHTVHRHVANIFAKLNLPSRAAAAAYAAQHYWL